MTEVENNPPGRVEPTAEIKALAIKCVAEGITAAEVTDVSEEVRVQLSAYLRKLGGQAESAEPRVSSGQDVGKDVVEEDLRLKRFAEQYRCLAAKYEARCPWKKVQERLLKNSGRYLGLAEGMNGGGVLFGVDKDGNPVIADTDPDPMNLPHCGLNYADTRKAVYLKDPQGNWEADNMSGYEMFPYAGGQNGYDKSDEILAFEGRASRFV